MTVWNEDALRAESDANAVTRFFELQTVRRALLLLLLAAIWESYARYLNEPLLLPTLSRTLAAGWSSIIDGELPLRIAASLQLLAIGYAIGIVLAAVLVAFSVASRTGTDLLAMLTGMFNPLPAIALLPIALLWFGLGPGSLIFVLVHSVVWAVAINAQSGFRSVAPTLRMVGRSIGLKGARNVVAILIPAAFPSILAGLKIGWAFAWRTLIAAELVFGASSRGGGLGWYLFEHRNQLETDKVFAGLLTVVLIGLIVEWGAFGTLERRTVARWGMQR
ncbi:MAG: putative ABC-type nitrate/sulfonate/bicarbonate transport system permease component [Rhodospirillales bacterium]|nr:putative ABC-type nitrate/sulfonate/bicarbonate transport system permease component [Rhodospirillales bacterium]